MPAATLENARLLFISSVQSLERIIPLVMRPIRLQLVFPFPKTIAVSKVRYGAYVQLMAHGELINWWVQERDIEHGRLVRVHEADELVGVPV